MPQTAKRMEYPHIVSDPEISAGAPLIEGTRITVRTIAAYHLMGMTVDEILNTLPHLTPSQVHAALAFYFDHQNEVDSDLADSTDEEYWKARALLHPSHKRTSA